MELPKNQNENSEKQNQENKEKFDKAFGRETQKPNFDKNSFNEMVNGANYDENLSKEENAQNAFNGKVDELISKNLKNLPQEQRDELNQLIKQANEGKNIDDLIITYNEIKQEFSNRSGESAKSSQDQADKQSKDSADKENKSGKEYLDKLKEGIKQNQEIADKKAQDLEKQNKEIEKATKKQQGPEADKFLNDHDDILTSCK